MREALSYGISALVHAVVLLWLAQTWEEPPQLLSLDSGRASIVLMASTGLPGEPMEVIIEALSPVATESAKLQEVVVERQQKTREPAAVREPVLETPENGDLTVVSSPPGLVRSEAQDESQPSGVPRMARANRSFKTVQAVGGHSGVDARPPSLASMASAGADVEVLPVRAANQAPVYPVDALLAQQEGLVTLRAVVGADGTVQGLRVETSSGYQSLDNSALAAVRQWRFKPGRRGGVPAAFELLIPVRYSIRDQL